MKYNKSLTDIANSLSPEDVIKIVYKLGATDHIEKNDCIIFHTICHHKNEEDGNNKLYYYKNTHLFVCYSHCGTFNIYELFKKRYNLLEIEYTFKDILKTIFQYSNTRIDNEIGFKHEYESIFTKYDKNMTEVNFNKINPSILNTFNFFATPEWLNDGISEESMKLYGIKYSIDQNKIIIPHYDCEGNLIGIRGRALNEKDIEIGKYMPIEIGGKIYSHPLGYNLYGLNFVRGNIKRKKLAIIGESEKFCLQYDTMFGHSNNITVAVCGSTIHKYQIDLLRNSGAEKILVAFDKEGETWEEKEKYYNKLKNICKKYMNICSIGFIYDRKNILKLKESPTDKGKDSFLKLYKSAIWLS